MENEINKINSQDWLQRWAGSYTFISCDYWGRQYFDSLKKYLGIGFEHSLFIHKKGTASFFLAKNEFEKFGKIMAEKAIHDLNLTEEYLQTLKSNADKINVIMKKLENTIPTPEEYKDFLFLYEKHLPFHNFMKKTVDFLEGENLKNLLPIFTEARIYSEDVYSNTESFFRSIADTISQKTGENKDYLTCLTQDEFEKYIYNEELPQTEVLKARFDCSALYFENGEQEVLLGDDVLLLEEKMLEKENSTETITGTNAFPGLVTGTVRIVPDPFNVPNFEEGDILVTGMTRPEFLQLIQKSGAIVTDAGGILCHAAIIARELKKTCVVGTRIASKILKDGDRVEVDANKGIIKIIK